MNLRINHIIDHLFQKETLEDVDVRDIEEVKDRYPYYAPVQYLLIKKYQQIGSELYEEQLKKAALYFTNPHWLNALLHPEELPEDEVIFKKAETEIVVEVPVMEQVPDSNLENANEQSFVESNTIAHVEENGVVIQEEPVTSEIESNADAIIAAGEEEVKREDESQYEEQHHTNPDIPVVEIKDNNAIVESIIDVEQNGEEDGSYTEEIDAIKNERFSEDIKLPTGDFSLAEAKAAFTQPLPDNIKASDAIIPIEPLHTVDYFASQGIKLSNEYEGKDKLTQKLRSFTEWLKTMKKIHPEKLENEIDGNTQTSIQRIAEHSNEQKEIVTEAIAEVYAHQGLNKKAIETYEKLSLLNPDKRVYFAAKISKLNNY